MLAEIRPNDGPHGLIGANILILSNRLGRKNERPIDSREIALIYRLAVLVEIVASLEYVTQVSLASRLPKTEDTKFSQPDNEC
jgi:hypothetical protein